jgi:hypothetical protein
MASRDELLDQIVPLRKKFVKYSTYADATIETIFPPEKIAQAKVFRCDQLASGILYNQGDGHFSFTPLPLQAQFSRVFGAVADDFDGDGLKDILVAGNFFPYRTQLGRDDAGLGMLLKGTGREFRAIDPALSGCYIGGDTRGIMEIRNSAGERLLIIAKNDDAVQVLKVNDK